MADAILNLQGVEADISDNVPPNSPEPAEEGVVVNNDPFERFSEHPELYVDQEVEDARWDYEYDEEGDVIGAEPTHCWVVVMFNVASTQFISHPIIWETEMSVGDLIRQATSAVKEKLLELHTRRLQGRPLPTRQGFGVTSGMVVYQGPFSVICTRVEELDQCVEDGRVTVQRVGVTIFGSALDG